MIADRQVDSYRRWLSEHSCERSVLKMRDWLKQEVRIKVEAVEMVHGITRHLVHCVREATGFGHVRGFKV